MPVIINGTTGISGLTFDSVNVTSNLTVSNTLTANIVLSNTETVSGNVVTGNLTVSTNLTIARINANSTTGISGQVLTSNGSGNLYWSNTVFTSLNSNTAVSNTQTFNASGTWTKPASGTYAVVRLWGAGGGAYWSADVGFGGAGGGGGGFHERFFLLSDLTSTVTVTVGAGGVGVYGSGGQGGDGGTTTFGSYFSAYGGTGAVYNGGFIRGSGGGSGPNQQAAGYVVAGAIPATGIGFSNTATVISTSGFVPMINNPRNGAGDDGVYGGGNGGTDAASQTAVAAGNTVFGGGGGAGNATLRGTSIYGGNGGLTGNGTQPGGGGAAYNVGAYNGAAGRCIVYVV